MTCQQTHKLLHSYIDGELDFLNNVDLERHFEECEPCAVEYRNQLSLRTLIKQEGQYFEAPDILKKRIQKSLAREVEGTAKRSWFSQTQWRVAALVLVTLSAALIGFILVNRSNSQTNDLLAQEVVSNHVRSLLADHLIDVASSDQHTVKPWFDGKVNFSPVVKDLSPQGFPLIGGRLDYVANQTVAALVYQRRKHYINLFIWPNAGPVKENSSIQGFNVICWNSSGTSYCAVSDMNAVELQQFASLIQG